MNTIFFEAAKKLALTQPKGTYKRIKVEGEITNYLAYKDNNSVCYVLADHAADLDNPINVKIADFFAQII